MNLEFQRLVDTAHVAGAANLPSLTEARATAIVVRLLACLRSPDPKIWEQVAQHIARGERGEFSPGAAKAAVEVYLDIISSEASEL